MDYIIFMLVSPVVPRGAGRFKREIAATNLGTESFAPPGLAPWAAIFRACGAVRGEKCRLVFARTKGHRLKPAPLLSHIPIDLSGLPVTSLRRTACNEANPWNLMAAAWIRKGSGFIQSESHV